MTSDTWHVMPNDDLIAHDDTADCACLPRTDAVQREDGSIGWVVVHGAWDGRQ